ncbi:MAG: alpha/beta hydrolase [Pseudomonadales bacterium]|nr:alpha/beta hydrolase [Pseudomonadales bacterium]
MLYLKYTGLILLALFGMLCLHMYSPDLPRDIVDARYSSPASQFLVSEKGLRIHFRDEGNQNGHPIVLVHGAFSSLHAFESWSRILGDQFRIISLDLPGHGLTGATPSGDYSNGLQLDVVNAVSQHLGLSKFTIGGNSMGGGVSWRYALKYPERIAALILIDSSGPAHWHTTAEDNDSDSRKPLVTRLLGQNWFRAIAANLNPYYLVKQGLASAYHQQQTITEALIDRYVDLNLRAGTRQAILSRTQNHQSAPSERLDPSHLPHPTLILWGREDHWIDLSYGHRFASVIANSHLIVYPEVGHLPMEEVPDVSAQHVRKFLNDFNLGRPAEMINPRVAL